MASCTAFRRELTSKYGSNMMIHGIDRYENAGDKLIILIAWGKSYFKIGNTSYYSEQNLNLFCILLLKLYNLNKNICVTDIYCF